MTPETFQDLLVPPVAADRLASRLGIDELAEALLQRFRLEDQKAPDPGPFEALAAEASDALYAWGVACYEKAHYADALALFRALQRRCPPSFRLCKALVPSDWRAANRHAQPMPSRKRMVLTRRTPR